MNHELVSVRGCGVGHLGSKRPQNCAKGALLLIHEAEEEVVTSRTIPNQLVDNERGHDRLAAGRITLNPEDAGNHTIILEPSFQCVILEDPFACSHGPAITEEIEIAVWGFGRKKIVVESCLGVLYRAEL